MKWKLQFILSLSLWTPPKKRSIRLLEKQWKSLSFDTDAVVLLPLFMKCLFCFFNEIFNVKVLFSSCYLAKPGGRGNKKRKSRKHAKSNFSQKQSPPNSTLSPRKAHQNEYVATMACEVFRKTIFMHTGEKVFQWRNN